MKIETTQVLDLEPEQAHTLQWMPLAIRFKLDVLGLHLGLKAWQALPHVIRAELVKMNVQTTGELTLCRRVLVDAGAQDDPKRKRDCEDFDTYLRCRRPEFLI